MAWSNKIMIYLDKAVNIIYLNLLWVAGVLLGLGFLGCFLPHMPYFICKKMRHIKRIIRPICKLPKAFSLHIRKAL